jgi:hypothetical protein
MNTTISTRLGYFISPHGFGHAARAAAVMEAVGQLLPAVHFDIFTQVPRWFFLDSLSISFTYHSLLTDVGLVQKSSLHEDIPATLQQLAEFLPFSQPLLARLARSLQDSSPPCQLILCDISPLGLAVARTAHIPSVLIENFTWDWIYDGYPDQAAALAPYISYLRRQFRTANFHIQTEPVCRPEPTHFTSRPVSRQFRSTRTQTRHRLNLTTTDKLVLLTMGGTPWNYTFLSRLKHQRDVNFVIAGGRSRGNLHNQENVIILDANSGVFHPDLIAAADAVIGKVGYSTLAEVYQTGVPFGYIARPHFRESEVLIRYIRENMSGLPIPEEEFLQGDWITIKLPALLEMPRSNRAGGSGASQIAAYVISLLKTV